VDAAQPAASRHPGWYVLMMALFALGLMCKPALVTLPFVLLLLDYWPLRRLPIGLGGAPLALLTTCAFRQLILEKAPLFVLSAVSCWITAAAHKALGSTEAPGLTLGLRIENAIVSYGRYLGKIVWPSDLAIIYPYPEAWPKTTVFITLAVLLLITIVVVRDFRLRPYLLVGWFWFLGVLVPAIGIVQAGPQAMADRFAYVPVIGVFVMIVWTVAEQLSSETRPAWVPGLAAGLAVASCVVITWVQLGHWKTSETVFKQALKVTPGNYVAHINLAVHYLGRAQTNAVVTHATEALRANRESYEPYLYLGRACELANDIPGAISNYHRALSIEPKWEPARKALAAARGEHSRGRTQPE
jgi:protein O-mannosyl-transferase